MHTEQTKLVAQIRLVMLTKFVIWNSIGGILMCAFVIGSTVNIYTAIGKKKDCSEQITLDCTNDTVLHKVMQACQFIFRIVWSIGF
jgi:hypothetical protein